MLISRELLGLDEFLFENFESLLIQVELDFQCPVCHTLPLTEQSNHLIEDGVKIHRDPPTRSSEGGNAAMSSLSYIVLP